jgi:hypothetical protein
MTGIAFMFLRYTWPLIVGGLLWWWADAHWCNGACRKADARADAAEAQIAAARQRATDLALLATQRLSAIDAAVKRQKDTDDAAFHALAARANALPAAPTVHLSFVAGRMWRDAAAAANDSGPSFERAQPADAVPNTAQAAKVGGGAGDEWYSEQDIGVWVVEASKAYRDAFAHWAACVEAYDQVRATYTGGAQ